MPLQPMPVTPTSARTSFWKSRPSVGGARRPDVAGAWAGEPQRRLRTTSPNYAAGRARAISVRVRRETTAPEAVAEDRDRVRAGHHLLIGKKVAAEGHAHTQERQIALRHEHAVDRRRLAAGGQEQSGVARGGHCGK
jgi:hypothetical protein